MRDTPPMADLDVLIARVARLGVPVLVTGDRGADKERVVEAIVAGSPRAAQPFLRFHCGAFAVDRAEVELLGRRDSGARAKAGLVREAHQGTLLLGEIDQLPPALQAKLLPALDDVDVRVIATTSADLGALVASGSFRRDLFHRVSVVRLHLPPLRAVEAEAAQRAPASEAEPLDAGPAPRGLRAQVDAFERRLLVQAMAEARGNQAEAARLLQIGRATMHDKLRKHRLDG
ncbi:MAG: sigma 54-interacting transcriptional regulator [Byssovorax sp.]